MRIPYKTKSYQKTTKAYKREGGRNLSGFHAAIIVLLCVVCVQFAVKVKYSLFARREKSLLPFRYPHTWSKSAMIRQ